METTDYKIGDSVWIAQCYCEQVFVTCPDCGGTGRIRCIMHDDTEVSIECGRCRSGYDAPSGRVGYYKRNPRAESAVITGMNIETVRGVTETEYVLQAEYTQRMKSDRIALSYEDAMAKAEAIAAKENAEEIERIAKKEKDTRTWAWNASYHRKCIKDAEKQIAYHTKKLDVAAIKAKEDRQNPSRDTDNA